MILDHISLKSHRLSFSLKHIYITINWLMAEKNPAQSSAASMPTLWSWNCCLLRNTPMQELAHLSLSPWVLDTYTMFWSLYGINGWRMKSPQYFKILKKKTAHDGSMCLMQIMNLKQVCNSINPVCVSAKCIPNSIWDLWGLNYEIRLLSASLHDCMGIETERGIPWELH